METKGLTSAEVMERIRMQLSKRGGATYRMLINTFKIYDVDKNGHLNAKELESVLSKCGVFLPMVSIKQMVQQFDDNKDGTLSWEEFLKHLKGKPNERRMAMIKKAFCKMDTDGSGEIDFKDVQGTYDVSRHPKVLSGEKSEREVQEDFLKSFEGAGGNHDGVVTWEEFVDYYAGISASFLSDDYFVEMMERCWKLSERDTGVAEHKSAYMENIKEVLKEKVRQKTKGARSEAGTIERAFKFFDLNKDGTLQRTEFTRALENLGVFLPEADMRTLFDSFDTDKSNTVAYAEFIKFLYA